jgi:acetolactate synthase-1/3 small subunit
MKATLTILLENEAGALSRVAGLFSARGYNIESLCVAPTEDPTMSRMTLVTSGGEQVIEQIVKQLNKLIDVVKLQELTDGLHVERELMLVKVITDESLRGELLRLAQIFRGNIVDVASDCYTIEITGSSDKLTAFLEALPQGSILEVARSGEVGLARGSRSLKL